LDNAAVYEEFQPEERFVCFFEDDPELGNEIRG
jgi:hypothetical protein